MKCKPSRSRDSKACLQDVGLGVQPRALPACSALLDPPCSRTKETQPCLEETGRELDFSLLFLSKNLIWNPEISPPARSFRICSAFPSAVRRLQLVGANCLDFLPVILPCTCRRLLPQPSSVLLAKFWFLIVLSVSIEIECSVLCE
ncbi:hypothetical protein SLEP1_g3093 [Rubroshorea leprosula]|uniref:Uncharacterized protein n=1 Tax=Rubroshorea leprosula TaxID=152421 RepID=A0AAV5HSJ0_9ROSI|nr:hypothetical protein SLEP1_g3093 [Rubroshorea leprosula]